MTSVKKKIVMLIVVPIIKARTKRMIVKKSFCLSKKVYKSFKKYRTNRKDLHFITSDLRRLPDRSKKMYRSLRKPFFIL